MLLLFNTELEANAIRQKKKGIRGIWIGKKEIILSLFADDMIFSAENPKASTKKLLELINKYSKFVRFKINTKK